MEKAPNIIWSLFHSLCFANCWSPAQEKANIAQILDGITHEARENMELGNGVAAAAAHRAHREARECTGYLRAQVSCTLTKLLNDMRCTI